jgi:1-deoxy-D-xylulose-5-phosphate reductoisomerase
MSAFREGESRGVAILGSTGSIGRQTLEVIEAHPGRFRVVALAGGANHQLLIEQSLRHCPDLVVTAEPVADRLGLPDDVSVASGPEGLKTAATHPDAEIVVVASAGHAAIGPTIDAVALGKTIAIANKETIVCAGALIWPLAARTGAMIHPVDSEHSAIWQSLDRGHSEIARAILTASGGPFLHTPLPDLGAMTVEEALGHPTWTMGHKITIDSATMMNKGLELIEAHWLFGLPFDHLDVVVHPQSLIHSIVEYVDGSQIAQLSLPDMRLPIQFALTYPQHLPSPCRRLDLSAVGQLTFLPVDPDRFPALELAREAGRRGNTYPTVLSSADTVAVEAYLDRQIGFGDIIPVVQSTLDAHQDRAADSLETVLAVDAWSTAYARSLVASRISRR